METILRLQQFVLTHPSGDMPVGIAFTGSGYAIVLHRLSSASRFDNVEAAIEYIRTFLDENE